MAFLDPVNLVTTQVASESTFLRPRSGMNRTLSPTEIGRLVRATCSGRCRSKFRPFERSFVNAVTCSRSSAPTAASRLVTRAMMSFSSFATVACPSIEPGHTALRNAPVPLVPSGQFIDGGVAHGAGPHSGLASSSWDGL